MGMYGLVDGDVPGKSYLILSEKRMVVVCKLEEGLLFNSKRLYGTQLYKQTKSPSLSLLHSSKVHSKYHKKWDHRTFRLLSLETSDSLTSTQSHS